MKKSEARDIKDACVKIQEQNTEMNDKLDRIIKRTDKVINKKETPGFRSK